MKVSTSLKRSMHTTRVIIKNKLILTTCEKMSLPRNMLGTAWIMEVELVKMSGAKTIVGRFSSMIFQVV